MTVPGIQQQVETPFTRLYSAIADLFRKDQTFNSLIAPGNQIFMDGNNREPIKQTITSADLPEFVLTAKGGSINLTQSSSSSSCEMNYSAVVSTGDYRINHYVNVITWMMMCNVLKWRTLLKDSVQWKGETFVKKMSISDAEVSESNPQRNRNISGYAAIWSFNVYCSFTTSKITFSELANDSP